MPGYSQARFDPAGIVEGDWLAVFRKNMSLVFNPATSQCCLYRAYIQLLTHSCEPVRARAHNSEGATQHREHESSQNNLTDNRV